MYDVVIVGSPNVNEGYKLLNNAAYPQIAADYERMFRVLKSLPCDVFLGAHGGYYGLEAKYARLKDGGTNPFVDPEGYRSYVAERERAEQLVEPPRDGVAEAREHEGDAPERRHRVAFDHAVMIQLPNSSVTERF